ncbi:MAG: hypothetical protein HQ508_08395 [Candidatus Marinimicrobia bacterium]|nr:hypothetical protein [Candidatus Neomarinimicrobiota bacterium]
MSEQKSGLKGLVQEFRNRRVFRVAAVYLGAGFAILEAADIIVPMFGFPKISLVIILGLLMIGFPIATTLSWHLQLTEDGIRRSPKSGEKQTADHKPMTSNGIIVALLIVIVALLSYPRFADSGAVLGEDNIAGIDPKSIAVLPFTSFTDEREDEIFADGMHDDILTQLSKIRSLKVISRTTMIKYKGTEKSIKDIAQEVGVANLLEGSVRRAGNQVRIVAQLISAKSDEHLWAETYDRAYADIFSIQSDVAKKIATALKSALTPEEKAKIEEIPTSNMQAYDFFLRGNHYWYTKTTKDGNMKAATLYEEAIKLDPTFGLAYARLSIVHSVLYQDGRWDQTPERKALAQAALERAVALIPFHPETHFAQGVFSDWCLDNQDTAIKEFEMAIVGQPGNDEIAESLGQLYFDKGELNKAGNYLQMAYDINPEGINHAWRLGAYYYFVHDYHNAEKYLQKNIELDPEGMAAYRYSALVAKYGYGDLRKADQRLREGILNSTGEAGTFATEFFQTAIESRDFAEALRVVEEEYTGSWSHGLKAFSYYLTGNQDQLRIALDSALIDVRTRIQNSPEVPFFHNRYGLLLAIAGEYDEAIKEGQIGNNLVVQQNSTFGSVYAHMDMASIYTLAGMQDLAMDELEYLISLDYGVSKWEIKLSPLFDSLRKHPRYQKLMLDMS